MERQRSLRAAATLADDAFQDGQPMDDGASEGDARPPFQQEAARPLPVPVWVAIALLVSAILFLSLRLAAVRVEAPPLRDDAPEGPPAPTTRPPLVRPADAAARALLPAASPEAFAALVEGWRRAWEAKELRPYLGYYASVFGSQGRDYSGWAAYKARVFASDERIEVQVTDLRSEVLQGIAMVTFVQRYRAEGYEDRGLKRLYLVPEDGRWKIFNEEWTALP